VKIVICSLYQSVPLLSHLNTITIHPENLEVKEPYTSSVKIYYYIAYKTDINIARKWYRKKLTVSMV